MEYVILVDEQDRETGIMEKQQAHLEGRLHRAISVFIFNTKNELLLQQRATGKYHSANLWTNTCCSHPRPGEDITIAASRRLYEEMGIRCELDKAFSFIYKAELDNHLTEHELDYVYTGLSDIPPIPNIAEVAEWKYIGIDALRTDMNQHPEKYTEWFKICINNRYNELMPKQLLHESI